MKFQPGFWLFLFCFAGAPAQNLVPDFSFEDAVNCPGAYGEAGNAQDWSAFRESPDYLNSCATSSTVSVPNNTFGKQEAADGNAYMHMALWSTIGFREYIGARLLEPLKPGEKYYLSAWICRAVGPHNMGACNNFGFRFTSKKYSEEHPCPTDNFSQFHCTAIVTDSLDWTHIRGEFVCDSAYTYVVLGNFYDNAHTDTGNFPAPSGYASYFVDFICVTTDSTTCGIPPMAKSNEAISLPALFPNPTPDGHFFIDNNVKSQIVSMRLLDAYGNEIPLRENPSVPGSYLLPARGVYYLELSFPNTKLRQKITW